MADTNTMPAPVTYTSDGMVFGNDAPSERSASNLSSPEPWFIQWATGNQGLEQGPYVNEHTALNYLAVYSCVSLIAGAIAALPLVTYRQDGRKKTRATDLRVYSVLHDEFNPRMSSAVARETMTGHLLTWGNEYAQIIRNKSGSEVVQLQPLGPDIVEPRLNDRGDVVYDVFDRETRKKVATLDSEDMIHVPGMGFDGICGYSPIRVAKKAIRCGMAQDNEAERFITRGIRPPGAIKFPTGRKFKDQAEAEKFRAGFRKLHNSEDNSLNIMVLEDGASWEALGIDPESAQLLESRQFSRGEIAGLYRVPPHLVGDVNKVTSWGTGIAEQVDGFVKFTLLPWLVKKEMEKNRKLFGNSKDLYCKYTLEGLERANLANRTASLFTQFQCGAITQNEWREVEDRNPLPGGDVSFYPLNLGRVDSEGNDIPPPSAGDGETDAEPIPPPTSPAPDKKPILDDANDSEDPRKSSYKAQLAKGLRGAIIAGVSRCLRKEAEQAKRAANKPNEFLAWADAFYAKHQTDVEESLRPLLEAWQAAFPVVMLTDSDWPTQCAANHCETSRLDLVQASDCKPSELVTAVEKVTERWLSSRLIKLTDEFQVSTSIPS